MLGRRAARLAVLRELRIAGPAGSGERGIVTLTSTAERLLGELLPSFCASCGERLPAPGEVCACGTCPPLTRAEAAARLEQPGMAAMLEARRLRGEALEAQDHVSALLLQADMIEHIDRLQQARDAAAAPIAGVRAEVARLGKDLKRAQGREREAAARAEDARGNFAAAALAEESARRMFAPAAERTDALVKMNAAASVLEGDQGALQGAAAVRLQAENDLAAARSGSPAWRRACRPRSTPGTTPAGRGAALSH